MCVVANIVLLLNRKDVHLKCSDGSLLGLILGSMPDSLRSGLETSLLTAMGCTASHPVLENAATPDQEMNFQAIHFSYYARNGEKVSREFIIPTHTCCRALITEARETLHPKMHTLCTSSQDGLHAMQTIAR